MRIVGFCSQAQYAVIFAIAQLSCLFMLLSSYRAGMLVSDRNHGLVRTALIRTKSIGLLNFVHSGCQRWRAFWPAPNTGFFALRCLGGPFDNINSVIYSMLLDQQEVSDNGGFSG